jgi:hypothetical protein
MRDEFSTYHHQNFGDEQTIQGNLTADMSSLNISMVSNANPRQIGGAQGGGGYFEKINYAPATKTQFNFPQQFDREALFACEAS